MNTSSAFISSSSRVAGTAAAAMVAALAGPAAAAAGVVGGAEGAVGSGVVIDLGDRSWKVARVEEVVPVLRELGAALRRDAVAYRDAQLRLGRALVQVRAQVPAGARGVWEKLVDALGLNLRTVQACMRRAERFTDEHGRLDVERVRETLTQGAAAAPCVRETLTQGAAAAPYVGGNLTSVHLTKAALERVERGRPTLTDLDRVLLSQVAARRLEEEVEGVGAEEDGGGDGAWWDEDELGELDEGEEDGLGDAVCDGAGAAGGVAVDVAEGVGAGGGRGVDGVCAGGGCGDRAGVGARAHRQAGVGADAMGVGLGRRSDVAGQGFLTALYDEARAAVAAFLLRMSRGELDEAGVRRVIAVMKGAV